MKVGIMTKTEYKYYCDCCDVTEYNNRLKIKMSDVFYNGTEIYIKHTCKDCSLKISDKLTEIGDMINVK